MKEMTTILILCLKFKMRNIVNWVYLLKIERAEQQTLLNILLRN